jgi:hypothetical protein
MPWKRSNSSTSKRTQRSTRSRRPPPKAGQAPGPSCSPSSSARIDQLDPTDDAWLDEVRALGATLDAHIAREETDIWPRIRAAWDQATLDRAGRQMAEAKAAVENGKPVEAAVLESATAR